MKVEISELPRPFATKPAYWKLNSAILENDELIPDYQLNIVKCKSRAKYRTDFNSWWNTDFKTSTRNFFKNYTINRNISIMNEKSIYYRAMQDFSARLNAGEDVDCEMNFIKTRLYEIEKQKLQEFSQIFQPNSLVEDEKIGIFQIAQHNERKQTTSCVKIRDELTTDINIIKGEFFRYYKTIFEDDEKNSRSSGYQSIDFITTRLNRDQENFLLKAIDEDELTNVLNNASKKKSPGPDGLSYEFYLKNFDTLKEDLLILFNGYLVHGIHPPADFKEGVVTFIPKSNNPSVKDFRPISLLNTDYKLFTKILANRIQSVLPDLIGPYQAACHKEKSCVENLKILRNLVAHSNNKKSFKIAFLSLDLQKAFDRVDRKYLWAVLTKFGFPSIFIQCIKNLYEGAFSKLLVAGSLTNSIKINRSVRQGCPLSMILFVLYLEPLLAMLSEAIPGVLFDGTFVKMVVYADDICLIIKKQEEFEKVFQIMTRFAKEARVSLNNNKSCFLCFNDLKIDDVGIEQVDELKILGVTFRNTWEETVSRVYENQLNIVKSMLFKAKYRNLNIIQKIWILNTYILSKLWYVGQIIPAPNKFIAEVTKVIGNYLWMGHLFKINRNQLYLARDRGGLDLIHVGMKIKALFIRNMLYTSAKNGSTPSQDFLFRNRKSLKLGRTFGIYGKEAENLVGKTNLNTTKQIYTHFIDSLQIQPAVVLKNVNFTWENIWLNLNMKFIDSNLRVALYYYINDIIPTRSKLFKHKIRGTDDDICSVCGTTDDLNHRLKSCTSSFTIWSYVKEQITTNLRINVADPLEIIDKSLGKKNEKLGFWILGNAINYNLKNYTNGTLETFKNILCFELNRRKQYLDKEFSNYTNCLKM